MRKRLAVLAQLVLLSGILVAAERSATVTLRVQVMPKASVDPPQLALRFRVSPDGASDTLVQAVTVTASARALPGQQVRVVAHLASLSGPRGPAAGASIRWSGSPLRATGGAREALCSSGLLQPGAATDLVSGWQKSGSLACSIAFELAGSPPPGSYSGVVTFAVEAR